MATAKDILVKPIRSADGNAFVKAHHYSGKTVNNSQLHLGVFLDGRLHGVMQFGPSLDKRKIQGLVSGTQWHEFLELNRMAFDEHLPRNSESRALSVAWRLLRKHAPQVKWVISFADATQCGDGTIYRAAGFVLTGIKENDQIWEAPQTGTRFSRTSLTDNRSKTEQAKALEEVGKTRVTRFTVSKGSNIIHSASLRPGIGAISSAARTRGASSMKAYIEAGFRPLQGFQIRYIYFLDPSYRARLTVPELPYSEIERRGASMYLGRKPGGEGETDNALQSNAETEGARPISPLLKVTK
jgi:hypothetical protein